MPDSDSIFPNPPVEPHTFERPFYSPSSIVAIFNAATVTKEEKRLVHVKGVFKKTGTTNYGGSYYNTLKDEAADSSITLVTPTLLHNKLDNNKTIGISAFITRKLNRKGQIEIHINLVELLSERVSQFSAEDTKKILLINRKVEQGFKDLDACIKSKIFNNNTVNIGVIMGKSGIIDNDIKKGMQSALSLFNITYHRVSLSAPAEIISKIKQLDAPPIDLICVARGGGENLEIFEDLSICTSMLDCTTIIASAIGHADNVTLFEKLADKKFITPTQFGNYLKEIYDHTIEELQRSKAKLVQDVTQQLSAGFKKQIENLNEQLRLSKELHEKTKAELAKTHSEQLSAAQAQLKNFQDLASRTAAEKTALHQKEIETLRMHVEAMSKQLSSQQSLLKESKDLAASYQRQLSDAKSKEGVNLVVVFIVLIVGIIIGVLVARA